MFPKSFTAVCVLAKLGTKRWIAAVQAAAFPVALLYSTTTVRVSELVMVERFESVAVTV